MKKDSAKTKILHEAVKLIQSKGFNEVSVLEICAAAQVSEGSFYYYFPSKDDLVLQLVDDAVASNASQIDNLLECNTYFDKALALFTSSADQFQQFGPELIRAYYQALTASTNKEHAGVPADSFDMPAIRMIEKAQLAKEISNDASAAELFRVASMTAIGVNIAWCRGGGSFDLKEELAKQLTILFGRK